MKRFKKLLRMIGYILLIILAGFGIGLSGGVPLPTTKKRDRAEFDVELMESNDEEEGTVKADEQK